MSDDLFLWTKSASKEFIIDELKSLYDLLNDTQREKQRVEHLLSSIVGAMNEPTYPDPEDKTRQWCSEYNVYLRGEAITDFMLPPEQMKEIESWGDEYFKKEEGMK